MNLTKLNGNTYYINAPTNIGVYTYKNKNCLLIDTGINNSAARKIDGVLIENKLHAKYIINTHSHSDHCGGNNYFKENYTGCLVYTSAKEKLYMENPELRINMLYSSTPVKELDEEFKGSNVDFVLDYGTTKINDDKFEILELKGHSPESIGIITSDRVCFLGDAIFSDYTLDKYSFPYLFNIEESLKTLEKIKEIDSDFFMISHSDSILSKEDVIRLSERNIENINKYLEEMLELLDEPHSKEDLLENIIILNNLFISFKQYHLNYSSMSAFLAYLCNKSEVKHSVENGNVYYYKG